MRGSGKLALLLLGFTLLLIAFLDVNKDEQVDWTRTYGQHDKIPYGLFVAREELPAILNKDSTIVEDFSDLTYPSIREFLVDKTDATLVFVVNKFYESPEVLNELLSFVAKGGKVFISSNDFTGDILDTLGLKQIYYYPKELDSVLNFKTRPFFLNNSVKASYKDLDYPGLFFDLDSTSMRIAGYFEAERQQIPNFVEVKHQKGRFLLHLEPLMFTNYYMLQEDNYQYASSALKLIGGKQVYWYNSSPTDQLPDTTPLRVLLTHRGLRQAWYLLLFGLILFMLFKSKREQRAVKIVVPEPNLSKDFVKTIANLYYENGEPDNLIQKKIDYFLHDIRKHFQLDTLVLDGDFARQLALKSGVSELFCVELMNLILDERKQMSASDKRLVFLNRKIEQFKQQANLL